MGEAKLELKHFWNKRIERESDELSTGSRATTRTCSGGLDLSSDGGRGVCSFLNLLKKR